MAKQTMTFFAEWLPLPKAQFRIMVMLADVGAFRGNLSDMCRHLLVDPQHSQRRRLRAAIDELQQKGFIIVARSGNTYQLSLIPKEEELTMPEKWVARIRRHEYSSENVAWEIVLKVQLWLMQHPHEIVTNAEIAYAIESSETQVCAAKNILQNEWKALTKEYAYWKTGKMFRRRGQVINLSAWWS